MDREAMVAFVLTSWVKELNDRVETFESLSSIIEDRDLSDACATVAACARRASDEIVTILDSHRKRSR